MKLKKTFILVVSFLSTLIGAMISILLTGKATHGDNRDPVPDSPESLDPKYGQSGELSPVELLENSEHNLKEDDFEENITIDDDSADILDTPVSIRELRRKGTLVSWDGDN